MWEGVLSSTLRVLGMELGYYGLQASLLTDSPISQTKEQHTRVTDS